MYFGSLVIFTIFLHADTPRTTASPENNAKADPLASDRMWEFRYETADKVTKGALQPSQIYPMGTDGGTIELVQRSQSSPDQLSSNTYLITCSDQSKCLSRTVTVTPIAGEQNAVECEGTVYTSNGKYPYYQTIHVQEDHQGHTTFTITGTARDYKNNASIPYHATAKAANGSVTIQYEIDVPNSTPITGTKKITSVFPHPNTSLPITAEDWAVRVEPVSWFNLDTLSKNS